MTNDGLLVLECLFQTIWSLFSAWCIPGTNTTPAEFALFLISSGLGLRYVLQFLHSPNASFSGGMAGRNGVADYHNRGTGRTVSK